jgi:hypothetical protein
MFAFTKGAERKEGYKRAIEILTALVKDEDLASSYVR